MNTPLPRQRRFTADEFIAWAAEQPEGRYELAGGEVVAMAAERASHLRGKLAAVVAIATALRARGLPCEAMTDGMSVRIDDRTVYVPDALVRCGERTPGEAVEISDPVVVIEVVSPSSLAVDTGAKLQAYFRLPSVRHYLVVNVEDCAITHHRRAGGSEIATLILREGVLDLDPPGFAIEVADFFAPL